MPEDMDELASFAGILAGVGLGALLWAAGFFLFALL